MSTSRSKASKSRTRIAALRAVIDKECTANSCRNAGICSHEGEKEAAQRMLTRLLDKLQAAAQDERDERTAKWKEIYERGYDKHSNSYWRGEKHRSGAPLREVAVGVRTDIKMARKAGKTPLTTTGEGSQEMDVYRVDPIGEAPDGITFRVHVDHGGRGSIHIKIENIPTEWGWTAEKDIGLEGQTFTRWRPTRKLEDLKAELQAIGDEYNADHGSNSMTDCFTQSFFVFVEAYDPDDLALKATCERARQRRRERKRR